MQTLGILKKEPFRAKRGRNILSIRTNTKKFPNERLIELPT